MSVDSLKLTAPCVSAVMQTITTMKVNGIQNSIGVYYTDKNSRDIFQCLILCSTKERKSYRFETTWGE